MKTTARTECEMSSTRTLYNHMIKIPACKRLAACEMVLKLIEEELGHESYMYESITTMKVVCLVHEKLHRNGYLQLQDHKCPPTPALT